MPQRRNSAKAIAERAFGVPSAGCLSATAKGSAKTESAKEIRREARSCRAAKGGDDALAA
jgi:hypothetical protein